MNKKSQHIIEGAELDKELESTIFIINWTIISYVFIALTIMGVVIKTAL